jgi:hypothetical protein
MMKYADDGIGHLKEEEQEVLEWNRRRRSMKRMNNHHHHHHQLHNYYAVYEVEPGKGEKELMQKIKETR